MLILDDTSHILDLGWKECLAQVIAQCLFGTELPKGLLGELLNSPPDLHSQHIALEVRLGIKQHPLLLFHMLVALLNFTSDVVDEKW